MVRPTTMPLMPPEGFLRTSSGMCACAKAWQRNQNLSQSAREDANVLPSCREGRLLLHVERSSNSSQASSNPTRTESLAVQSTNLLKEGRATMVGLDCETHATSCHCLVPLELLPELVALRTTPPCTQELQPCRLDVPQNLAVQTHGQQLNSVASGKLCEPLQQLSLGDLPPSRGSTQ